MYFDILFTCNILSNLPIQIFNRKIQTTNIQIAMALPFYDTSDDKLSSSHACMNWGYIR